MTYRDDLAALAARHDALAGEVNRKTHELEEARRLLDQARARARLPVLDNIRVASPCTADWNQMTGDDRTRLCGACNKNVYNLSGMTRDEAEALLIERNGDLCVRYFQRADGTILLADCTVGAGHRRGRRRWLFAGAAALLAGGAVVPALMKSSQATMGSIAVAPDRVRNPDVTMGEVEWLGGMDRTPATPDQTPSEDAPPPPSMQLPVPAPVHADPETPRPVTKMGKLIRRPDGL